MSMDPSDVNSFSNASNKASDVYDNSEGENIPPENEAEFEEGPKNSHTNKTNVKLVLSFDKAKLNSEFLENPFMPSLDIPWASDFKAADMSQDSASKEYKCVCNGGDPPEWFTQYMKKFKKELLQELKSNLCDNCQNPLPQEKKSGCTKKETTAMPSTKIEHPIINILQCKKKKRVSENNSADALDPREVRLVKKIEKMHPIKHEKLESKTKVLLEERRKLVEKRRMSKLKLDSSLGLTPGREVYRKSGCFLEREIFLRLRPNSNFSTTLNFTNNGSVSWEAPWLECFEFTGMRTKESRIRLPKLQPMETCHVTISGKVGEREGLQHFKCRLFDCLEKLGHELICWATVEVDKPAEKRPSRNPKPKETDEGKKEDFVGISIDFDRDEFGLTGKKIFENIGEIRRRLKDLDLLRSAAKHSPRKAETTEEFQSGSGDSHKKEDPKKENCKEKPEQEGVRFGINITNPSDNKKKPENKAPEENGKEGLHKKTKKAKPEVLSSSDSELSVLFLSEDEDFSVVSLPSKTPTPVEFLDDDVKLLGPREDKRGRSRETAELNQQQNLEPPKKEVSDCKETPNADENPQRQAGSTKNRCPPFGEETPKARFKKIKSKSTEYNFTAGNLAHPIFIKLQHKFKEDRPPEFTFTGETEQQKSAPDRGSERHSSKPYPAENKEKKTQKEEDFVGQSVPTTDASGKVIYVVNSEGDCFPMTDLQQGQDYWKVPSDNSAADSRRSTKKREIPRPDKRQPDSSADASFVNPLPQVLTEASSAVMVALNNTKSLINTLLTMPVIPSKKPDREYSDKHYYPEMARLVDMGFLDINLNKELLQAHKNDLVKVLEVLLFLQENTEQP